MTQALPLERSMDDNLWDFYNGLLLGPDVERIRKLLVRYDLFRLSLDVPGDIVECGVFKGAGVMYWLKLLEIYAPAARKKVIGFDTFSAFSDNLLEYERASAQQFTEESQFSGVTVEQIQQYAAAAGVEGKLELVEGDIEATASDYAANNPGFRISLLHLDLDTYGGTKAALDALYGCVTPGGVVICDEYGYSGWGESDAIDAFLKEHQISIKAVPNSRTPTAYFVKPND